MGFASPQSDPESVSAVEFSRGPLDRISAASLQKLVVIEEGQSLAVGAVRATIKRLFATGLFEDIRISKIREPEGSVRISIELTERALLKQVEVKGGDKVPPQELRAALRLSPGQPYDAEEVELALERIKSLHREHGYYESLAWAETQILARPEAIRIAIQIETGPRASLAHLELDLEEESMRERLAPLLDLRVGGSYSNRIRDNDLQEITRWLAREGHLNPLVYVSEGPRYSLREHSVELALRIAPRRRTRIRFEGLPEGIDAPSDLTIYREGDAGEIFVQDSARELQEKLQGEGYLQCEVDYELGKDQVDAAQVAFLVTAGHRAPLKDIRFTGDTEGPQLESAMRSLLGIRTAGLLRGARFSSTLLSRDQARLGNFWVQRGYLNAQVASELVLESSGKTTLTFDIHRGDLYRVGRIGIERNSEIETERLRPEIRSHSGEAYSPLRVAQDRINLAAVYENFGYREVDVQVDVTFEGRVANLRFTIHEDPRFVTDEVIITGNKKTRESVIRREIPLENGDPLSMGRLLGAETSLYNLSIFNRVQVRDEASFQDEKARAVIVQVEEAPRYSLVYGFEYSSFEGPRGTVWITNNNLLGTARSLSLALRAGAQRQRGSLTYSLPRLFDWRIPAVLALSADNEQAQTRSTGSGNRAIRGRPFDSFRLTSSAQTEVHLSRRESLFLRIEYERIRSQVPDDLKTALEFFREQEQIDLSAISASYLNESRDSPINPTSGFFVTADSRIASRLLGSEEELFWFFSQGHYYRSIRPQVVWASALRFGVIQGYGHSNAVPISERFFAGGASSFRGIPQDLAGPLLTNENGEIALVDEFGQPDPQGRPVPLGGEAILLFNTEIRFPIYGFLRGVAFYDFGNVYERAGDLLRTAPIHSPGLGLHFTTPVGPVRFDVGYNPNPPAAPGFSSLVFHLTLGHPF